LRGKEEFVAGIVAWGVLCGTDGAEVFEAEPLLLRVDPRNSRFLRGLKPITSHVVNVAVEAPTRKRKT
jgi:hypothetical protein